MRDAQNRSFEFEFEGEGEGESSRLRALALLTYLIVIPLNPSLAWRLCDPSILPSFDPIFDPSPSDEQVSIPVTATKTVPRCKVVKVRPSVRLPLPSCPSNPAAPDLLVLDPFLPDTRLLSTPKPNQTKPGFQTSPGSIDSSRGLSEGFQAGPGSLDSSRGLSEGLSGGSGEYDSRSYANKLNVGTESRTGGGVTLDAGAGENDMGVRGGPGALGGQAQGGLGSSSGTGGSNSGGGSFGEQMKGASSRVPFRLEPLSFLSIRL